MKNSWRNIFGQILVFLRLSKCCDLINFRSILSFYAAVVAIICLYSLKLIYHTIISIPFAIHSNNLFAVSIDWIIIAIDDCHFEMKHFFR